MQGMHAPTDGMSCVVVDPLQWVGGRAKEGKGQALY